MRVVVDGDRCVGHGLCEAAVPDVFEVGDGGYVVIDDDTAGTCSEADLRTAVNNCPSAALSIID